MLRKLRISRKCRKSRKFRKSRLSGKSRNFPNSRNSSKLSKITLSGPAYFDLTKGLTEAYMPLHGIHIKEGFKSCCHRLGSALEGGQFRV